MLDGPDIVGHGDYVACKDEQEGNDGQGAEDVEADKGDTRGAGGEEGGEVGQCRHCVGIGVGDVRFG